MSVADDIKDGVDVDEGLVFFSSHKALYIDYDNLIPYQTNQINFIEFFIPKELEMQNLVVHGIFKSIIILTDNWLYSDYVDTKFCYFFSYNDRLQLQFCRRIDHTVSSDPHIEIYWCYFLEIIQEISKMFVRASANIAFVINLRTFQVSEILDYRSSFLTGMCFKWSEQNRMLNIKVNLEYQIGRPNQCFT